MGLVCTACGRADLHICGSVELGRVNGADETSLQRARCGSCRQLFVCKYTEVRSFRPDRDDRVSHVAVRSDALFWYLFSIAFEKPKRKKSAGWRIKMSQKLFWHASQKSDEETIRWKTD